MTQVRTDVLIPFESKEPYRLRNLEFVTKYYQDLGFNVVIAGQDPDRDGWCKASAVNNAIAKSDADVFIIADGDCICDGILPALAAVTSGKYHWASPHYTINRLDREHSDLVLAGTTPHLGMGFVCETYKGVAGGGITIVTRDAYEKVPLDPRFHATHGEDTSWGKALRTLVGQPYRTRLPLFHLWHPPVPPMGIQYDSNTELALRYAEAFPRPIKMQAIIDEIATWTPRPVIVPQDSGKTCAIIVPVMQRPLSAAPFMHSLGVGDWQVYAICDAEDLATISAWACNGAKIIYSDRGSRFGQKVNCGYESTSEPWLFFVGDDVRFHDGWLDTALAGAGSKYDLVSTNDLARPDLDELAIHPLVRRTYIRDVGMSWDGPGTVCHEGYTHWCVDLEWSALARHRGTYVYCPESVVEHLHPIWNKGEDDHVYQLGQAKSARDKRLYKSRSRLFGRRIRG